MKQLRFCAAVVVAATALVGCSTTATLLPTEGPLSKQAPVPLVTATVHGITSNSGDIDATMPNNDLCKGRWSVVAPQEVSTSFGASAGSLKSAVASAWGSVYGVGVTSRNIAGANKGQAFMTCLSGTVVQVEFVVGSGTASGYGVAVDNRGNTFKVYF